MNSVKLTLYPCYLYSCHQFYLFLLKLSLEDFGYLRVFSRQGPRHDLQHGDIRTEFTENECEFTPDNAGANNDKSLGNRFYV